MKADNASCEQRRKQFIPPTCSYAILFAEERISREVPIQRDYPCGINPRDNFEKHIKKRERIFGIVSVY
jgi:hypothetical protein